VIKPSHSSGSVLFCRDGNVDKETLFAWLKIDYYRSVREQNYAFLRPRIVVEEFALGHDTVPDDFKVFCVDGSPRAIWVTHRGNRLYGEFYDVHWHVWPVWTESFPQGPVRPRPAVLEELLDVAAKLATGFSLVRIDLYTDGSRVKVGEITHSPAGAATRYRPKNGESVLSAILFGPSADPLTSEPI
jgi:hypothetical protein